MRLSESRIGDRWEDLRVVFDSVPALIWYKDSENRILRANRRAAESMGLTVDEIEGASTYDLYPDEAAQYHRDDLEVIRSGQPRLGIVEPLLTATGEKRWVRTDKLPYRDPFGTVIGVIVFAVDVTDRVRAEKALLEAHEMLERRVDERTRELADALERLQTEMAERQRMEEQLSRQQAELAHLQRLRTVEEMAAQIAHEINQPLGAISNFASGLARRMQDQEPDLARLREVASQISQQAMRAASVVRRLRELVHKNEAAREHITAAELIADAIRIVSQEARRRGVTVESAMETDLPSLLVDITQIEHALVNLLGNALDAVTESDAPSGSIPRVRIDARRGDEGCLEIRVVDTGAGVPEENNTRIFAPFFTTKGSGLGMGLTISRSIIEAHGGTLTLQPVGDRGAAFLIVLPIV
jgi:PAS domain S-box-containing protein